jgi:hypothetical protein
MPFFLKTVFAAALACFTLYGAESSAQAAFKCEGEKSRFEFVEGYYLGEGSDMVMLKLSAVYGISNYGVDEQPGQNPNALYLKRTPFGKGVKSGVFKTSGLAIQFSAVRKDSFLGNSKLVFGIPMGVFGAGVGKHFEAAFKSGTETNAFQCEIVTSVTFN